MKATILKKIESLDHNLLFIKTRIAELRGALDTLKTYVDKKLPNDD